jgi:RNA polymerase sigma factor (sigma-70 family)
MMSDDMMLVREFAASQSEPAFAALVERHIGLVHSAALRQAGDAHLAEEITQAVFIILARKAASLGPKTILSAWLYRTARYAAADALKARRRRQAREQEAHMQSTLNQPDADAWVQLAPLLDDALAELGETDRTALVLRFFENKTAREIAGALRMEEAAAQKRVARALEKLRAIFVKRGVTLTATVIAGAVAANSVQAAPVALVKTISAVAVAKGVAATTSTLTLVKGTMKMMTSTKTFTAAAILTSAIFSQGMVASHFDSAGQANAWMDRSTYLIFSIAVGIGLPVFIIGGGYVLRFLPDKYGMLNIPHRDYWLAPERRDETFKCIFRFFLRVGCLEAIFLVGFQLLMVQANRQTPPHLSMSLVWGLTGCFLTIVAVWLGALIRHFMHVAREQ